MARAANSLPPNDQASIAIVRRRRAARWAFIAMLGAAFVTGASAVMAEPELPVPPQEVPDGAPVQLGPPGMGGGGPGGPNLPLPYAMPVRPSQSIPGHAPDLNSPLQAGQYLGSTPILTKEAEALRNRYFKEFGDPKLVLDVVLNRTRIVNLTKPPRRIQISDESIAAYNLASPTELLIQGRSIGTTTLNIWFATDPKDPSKLELVPFLLRVVPDPEGLERKRRALKAMAKQINALFCESQIDLDIIGDKIIITGRAHDHETAVKILLIVRSGTTGGDQFRIPSDLNPQAPVPVPGAGPAPANPSEGPKTAPADAYQTAGGPNIINLLQVTGEQQIKLHVVVAEVNRTATRSIGMNFSVSNSNGVTVFSNTTGFGGGSTSVGTASLATGMANIMATLGNGRIPIAIDAMRDVNYARSLAEPVLTALNGVTANFQAGGEFPVPVVAGGTQAGLTGVSFVPFGVQLTYTPFITDKDRIRLHITANVSTRDLSTSTQVGGSSGGSVSGLNTRNFDTTVELRDGETLAVAGLMQTNIAADSTVIPGIGDLPLIGNFTGLRRHQAGEQELVMLIWPELVHPLPPGTKYPLVGDDLFEPTDCEFYLIGRIESHYPEDYRSPIRNDLSRIMQYRDVENHYVAGQSGYSDQP